jgi:hypothetical protein
MAAAKEKEMTMDKNQMVSMLSPGGHLSYGQVRSFINLVAADYPRVSPRNMFIETMLYLFPAEAQADVRLGGDGPRYCLVRRGRRYFVQESPEGELFAEVTCLVHEIADAMHPLHYKFRKTTRNALLTKAATVLVSDMGWTYANMSNRRRGGPPWRFGQ